MIRCSYAPCDRWFVPVREGHRFCSKPCASRARSNTRIDGRPDPLGVEAMHVRLLDALVDRKQLRSRTLTLQPACEGCGAERNVGLHRGRWLCGGCLS